MLEFLKFYCLIQYKRYLIILKGSLPSKLSLFLGTSNKFIFLSIKKKCQNQIKRVKKKRILFYWIKRTQDYIMSSDVGFISSKATLYLLCMSFRQSVYGGNVIFSAPNKFLDIH